MPARKYRKEGQTTKSLGWANVVIGRKLLERLDELAASYKISRSELIRHAIRAGLPIVLERFDALRK